MITIFNRRELMVVLSTEKLFRIKNALAEAGIPCHCKTAGVGSFAANRCHGAPFINQDTACTHYIYVYKNDYDRAVAAIQPAMRDN